VALTFVVVASPGRVLGVDEMVGIFLVVDCDTLLTPPGD